MAWSDSPIITRPGTIDTSTLGKNYEIFLSDPNVPTTIAIDMYAPLRGFHISQYFANTIIATNEPIHDYNHDNIIPSLPQIGLFNLDGNPASAYAFYMTSEYSWGAGKELRYLGSDPYGVHVYADAVIRPKEVTEGFLGNDVLSGDQFDRRPDAFFYDSALKINQGTDWIRNFGYKDILVTTTELEDWNHDGIIWFGSDWDIDLPGGTTLKMNSHISRAPINALEPDGTMTAYGAEYFIYSRVGTNHIYAENLQPGDFPALTKTGYDMYDQGHWMPLV